MKAQTPSFALVFFKEICSNKHKLQYRTAVLNSFTDSGLTSLPAVHANPAPDAAATPSAQPSQA
jgi:hypothetical protein